MKDCLFCKVIAGEVPPFFPVMEDQDFVAFLSIFPAVTGMTMIATKKHFGSYLYRSLDDETLSKMHRFAKKMGLILDAALGAERCIQVMEGFHTDHAHIKLYPVQKGQFIDLGATDTREDDAKLEKLAEKIRKAVSIK